MKNIGDGKIILKGATRCFTQGQSEGSFVDNGDHAYDKGVCTAS
jgi:hypothetical protein